MHLVGQRRGRFGRAQQAPLPAQRRKTEAVEHEGDTLRLLREYAS
ncbi:hypothetical protein [Streptomyces sp. RPT161]|nr:hypothetical protein [Streptomyces sp. RPT161]